MSIKYRQVENDMMLLNSSGIGKYSLLKKVKDSNAHIPYEAYKALMLSMAEIFHIHLSHSKKWFTLYVILTINGWERYFVNNLYYKSMLRTVIRRHLHKKRHREILNLVHEELIQLSYSPPCDIPILASGGYQYRQIQQHWISLNNQ